ncbi:hypothetical protein GW17_00011838 [Ensete ventricosum]|nr:hypothetical protein GW17_00011838 [Ensete ventricosum]
MLSWADDGAVACAAVASVGAERSSSAAGTRSTPREGPKYATTRLGLWVGLAGSTKVHGTVGGGGGTAAHTVLAGSGQILTAQYEPCAVDQTTLPACSVDALRTQNPIMHHQRADASFSWGHT